MRVLLVNHSSATASLGGAERSALTFGEAWQRIDDQLELEIVTASADGLFAAEVERRGWSVFAVDFAPWALPELYDDGESHYRNSRRDDAAVLAILARLREHPADVVVSNSLVNPWGAVAAGIAGVPHVWFVREYGDLDHGLRFLLGDRQTWEDVGFLSDIVVANSEAIRDHAVAFLPGHDVRVAYPQVDLAALHAKPDAPGSTTPETGPTGALELVLVGSIRPAKQQLLAVEALGVLRERGVDAHLTLAGPPDDESYAAEVEVLAEQLGVADRVRVTGYLDDPAEVVREADVGLMLSRHEAFGRVTLEYLALGKPVVGVDSGGTTELVDDGVSGRLVPAEAASVADAVEGYARDRELLARHSAASVGRADEIAARYPVEPVIESIVALVAPAADGTRTGLTPKLPHLTEYWLGLAPSVEMMNASWEKVNQAKYDETLERLSQVEREVVRARHEAELMKDDYESELIPLRDYLEYTRQHPVLTFPMRTAQALGRRWRRLNRRSQ
jgi:glycosyltransferase involved in cell wall biosynthesis